MATDNKRLPAPESTPYHLGSRQKTLSYQEKLATTLQNGQRLDKRKFEETRKICKFCILCSIFILKFTILQINKKNWMSSNKFQFSS